MISESANTSGTVELPCGHCGEAASFACGQCKNMRYCSLECQQADWLVYRCEETRIETDHRMQANAQDPVQGLPYMEEL